MSEAAEPATKKLKTREAKIEPEETKSSISESEPVASSDNNLTEPQTNDQKEKFFDLSTKKRFTVREWKGNTLLDIREFYEKDGDMKPGKKGISLTLDQYKELRDLVISGSIDAVIKEKGGEL